MFETKYLSRCGRGHQLSNLCSADFIWVKVELLLYLTNFPTSSPPKQGGGAVQKVGGRRLGVGMNGRGGRCV